MLTACFIIGALCLGYVIGRGVTLRNAQRAIQAMIHNGILVVPNRQYRPQNSAPSNSFPTFSDDPSPYM